MRGLHWRERATSWRNRAPTTLVVLALLAAMLVMASGPQPVASLSIYGGDGVLLYGQSSNTTPQARTYSSSGNSFGSATGAVAGAIGQTFITRTSPVKQQALAGYVDSGGTLRVMCYNGSSWSNELSATVGGTGTTRRFDIAYETSSGDAMVLYSTNTGTTNELAYYTHPNASACGSGWSGPTSLDPVRTSGVVQWVKLAWDRRSSSDLITAIWADASSDLSAMVWSGSAWGNEPSAVLENDLDVGSAAQDVDDFDVEYETASGDVMVAWGRNVSAGTDGGYYATCTGGTSSCTWSSAASISGLADDAVSMDISANPETDEMVFGAVGKDQSDMGMAYWSGSAWTGSNSFEDTATTPAAGQKTVSTGWLISGNTTKAFAVYADATATSTSVSGYTWSFAGGQPAVMTDFAGSPTPGAFRWFDVQMDPAHEDRALIFYSDANNDVFSKRLVLSGGTFSWTNADGSAALEANLPQATASPYSFAFWRTPVRYAQDTYRWYQNTDAAQPTTAYANENTSYSFSSTASPLRLRMNTLLTDKGLAASSQAFKLQYATSTSGPWSDVADVDPWCSTASPLCNTSWGARRKVNFNNTASSTNLTNFTVMLKLNSSNIDYSKTQNSGQDLRFTDADGTALNYQIERWDETGNSIVWVKVPQIDAASASDYIWMYYDNASASAGQSASNTWDSSFKAVYHMNTDPTTASAGAGCDGGTKEICDSTSNANNGDSAGSMTSGDLIAGVDGYGMNMNGTSAYFDIPDSNSLDVTEYTLSAWVKSNTTQGYETVLCKEQTYCFQNGDTQLSASIDVNGTWTEQLAATGTAVPATWQYVTATFDTTNNLIKIYVNGTLVVSGSATDNLLATTYHLFIGVSSAGSEYQHGALDEVRIAGTPRSADWINADYLSTSANYTTFGSESTQSVLWKYKNNATPANGATLSSGLLSNSTVMGRYIEGGPTDANPNAMTVGSYTEWDFALDPANVSYGTYYFRMVRSNGTAFDTYTRYPQATYAAANTAPNAPAALAQYKGDGTTGVPATTVYSYDSTVGSSVDGNGGTLSVSTSVKRTGAGSMKDVTTANSVWINDGMSSTRDTSANGPTVSAWVYIPSGNSGTTWFAYLSIYDSSTVNHDGPNVNVARDTWTLITYTPPTSLLQSMKYFVVAAGGGSGGTNTVYVDDLQQGNDVWNDATSVVLKGSVSDVDSSDTDALCVEVQPIATPFTNSETSCGTGATYSGSPVTASVSFTLTNGTRYHWQARTKDAGGLYSSWTDYGGNANGSPADVDIGIDTTAPSTGTVYDGTSSGVQANYNAGSLSSLSANWQGFSDATSGVVSYDYSIGTTSGATDTLTWTSTTSTSMTATGLTLRTAQAYYVNVRAHDEAGNVSGVVSSPGQRVAPTLVFTVSSPTLTFSLNALDGFTDSKSVTATTSTNGYGGYATSLYALSLPSSGTDTLAAYSGTWASPSTWSGNGIGYTSSDTNVSGSNRFAGATKYAGLPVGVGNAQVAADRTAAVDGGVVGTPITSDATVVTFKVATSATQHAGTYPCTIVLQTVATY